MTIKRPNTIDDIPHNSLTNEDTLEQFKNNLRELFDHIDVEDLEEITADLKDAVKDIPVSSLWQNHISNCLEKWILALPGLEYAGVILKRWYWLRNPVQSIWLAITLLNLFGAGSVKQLVDQYSLYLESLKKPVPTGKTRTKFEQNIRNALKQLHRCGIIGKKKLTAKELGSGRLEVVIWFAPVHLGIPGALEEAIEDYKETGGRKTTKADLKEPKTQEDYDEAADIVVEFGDLVKRKTFLNKAKKFAKFGIYFYECPNCESVIRISKEEESLYDIDGNKILQPCRCGHQYRVKVSIPKTKKRRGRRRKN